MSGRLYSPAATVTEPRFEIGPDGTPRIVLNPDGTAWLVIDDSETAAALAVAAIDMKVVLAERERAERAKEIELARRQPSFTPRPACTCDPGDGFQHHPYCDLYVMPPDSAPAHTGDGTPGPESAASTGAATPLGVTARRPGPGARVEFGVDPLRACDCPVREGNTHQRATCTDPVAARLNWFADDPQDSPGPESPPNPGLRVGTADSRDGDPVAAGPGAITSPGPVLAPGSPLGRDPGPGDHAGGGAVLEGSAPPPPEQPGDGDPGVPNLGVYVAGETSHVHQRTGPPLLSGGMYPELAEGEGDGNE